MSKVTIYDVARVADVSLATVSRVLNNPEKVKPKTRERVLAAINELGYRPNAIARGLASRRSTNVGLIVPTCSRASVSEMIDGVADIADKYRYSVFLNVTHNENDIATNVWQNMIASQVDGVLMMADKISDDEIERLAIIHENFFTDSSEFFKNLNCHEIALYFLMKAKGNQNLNSDSYTQGVRENMVWIPIDDLDNHIHNILSILFF